MFLRGKGLGKCVVPPPSNSKRIKYLISIFFLREIKAVRLSYITCCIYLQNSLMSVRIIYITQFHHLAFAATIAVLKGTLLLDKCNIFHVQIIYYLVRKKDMFLGITFKLKKQVYHI